MLSAIPKKTFPVHTVNAKQKNPLRFIMHSINMASLPPYSLESAPSVKSRSGAAVFKREKTAFILLLLCV